MAVYRYWYIFGSGWCRIRALYFFLFYVLGVFSSALRERARLLFNGFSILPSGGNNLDLIFGKWPADAGAQKNHLANYAGFCCNFKSLWFFSNALFFCPQMAEKCGKEVNHLAILSRYTDRSLILWAKLQTFFEWSKDTRNRSQECIRLINRVRGDVLDSRGTWLVGRLFTNFEN